MSKTELVYLGTKIPRQLNEKITLAIQQGEFATKSELVRTALKALLKESK